MVYSFFFFFFLFFDNFPIEVVVEQKIGCDRKEKKSKATLKGGQNETMTHGIDMVISPNNIGKSKPITFRQRNSLPFHITPPLLLLLLHFHTLLLLSF